MAGPLLETKLPRPPDGDAVLVARPRLSERLSRGADSTLRPLSRDRLHRVIRPRFCKSRSIGEAGSALPARPCAGALACCLRRLAANTVVSVI